VGKDIIRTLERDGIIVMVASIHDLRADLLVAALESVLVLLDSAYLV
jgi:hypothetical protein